MCQVRYNLFKKLLEFKAKFFFLIFNIKSISLLCITNLKKKKNIFEIVIFPSLVTLAEIKI